MSIREEGDGELLGGGEAPPTLRVPERARDPGVQLRQFRTLAENIPENVAQYDGQGRLLYMNRRMLESLPAGYQPVLGKSPTEANPANPNALRYQQNLLQVVASGASTELEVTVPHASGEARLHRVAMTPARDERGEIVGVIAVGRDVTEHRRLEAHLQRAQKLEDLGHLAGGAAHDFNNVLTVILSCANAMVADLESGIPVVREDVEEIRAAAERARRLTRQLMAFARRREGEPVSLDLNGVITGLGGMLERMVGQGIRLQLDLQPELPQAYADPGQLEQILVNLVANARDATPAGGVVSVETRLVTAEEAGRIPGQVASPWLLLRVRDTGTGMTPEVRARLFEPFFTTKEPGRGTGLGLAATYGLVRQAGGQIRVESEAGKGSVFEIFLPPRRIPAA